MVVGAKVCELTDGFLWFVCGNFDVSPNKPGQKWPSSLSLSFPFPFYAKYLFSFFNVFIQF